VAVFVINEWLWADLLGENGPEARRETFSLIERIPSSEHLIVVVEGSAFDQKAWNLCRSAQPMIVQRIAKAYLLNIRQNSDRCLILRSDALSAFPEELSSEIKADDHYLVQAQLSVAGAILVTTDGTLRSVLTRIGLACLSREEFLKAYF
jgi:hypothetical protein